MKIDVQSITFDDVKPWLLQRHYAKRLCPVSFAFGAFRGSELIGVVTYGTPVSSPLRVGICGSDWASSVLELNRLCCENSANIASQLIALSLVRLPKPSVIVSFADCAQGHVGYVYQATNFIYTGLSAKRTDWKLRGQEHLHGATVADMSRGQENRAQYMREQFGDDFYLADRPRKHRYVYLLGNHKQKKQMRQSLRYAVEPYPKGDSLRYKIDESISTQQRLEI